MLNSKRRDILHDQLAQRVHLNEVDREQQKSFPISAEEAIRFIGPRLRTQLEGVGDMEARQCFTDAITAFAAKFAVTLTNVTVTPCNLLPTENGGIHRMGPLLATELRLLIRKGSYGPRVLATLTFPEGSVAGHRHDRISQIIAELAGEDQARLEKNEPPLLVDVRRPTPVVSKNGTGMNTAGAILAEQKELRVLAALLCLGTEYQHKSFKLAEAVQFVFQRTTRIQFPTDNYVSSAVTALEKKYSYIERGNRLKGVNIYFMTQKGRDRLNELRKSLTL